MIYRFGQMTHAFLAVLVFTIPGIAWAHPVLDQARAAYADGSFDRATTLLSDLDSLGSLTAEDLQQALALRAMSHRAAGHETELERDLGLLASLGGSVDLFAGAPPSLLTSYEARLAAATRITLAATHTVEGRTVRVAARAASDPGSLVRSYRLRYSSGGRSQVVENTRGEFSVEVLTSECAYDLQAIGPGGATLAVTEPTSVSIPMADETPARAAESRDILNPVSEPAPAPPEEERRRSPWLWVGVSAGVVAVAAAVVTVVLVTSSGSDDVPFQSPSIDF